MCKKVLSLGHVGCSGKQTEMVTSTRDSKREGRSVPSYMQSLAGSSWEGLVLSSYTATAGAQGSPLTHQAEDSAT